MTALALFGASLLMSTIAVDEDRNPGLWDGLTFTGAALVLVAFIWWLVG